MKNPYNKIIIWGLKKRYHTHRYIHQSFYETAKKLGWNVLWVEDESSNAHLIESGDLVISSRVSGKMIPEKKVFEDYALPIKDGVFYCLHNYGSVFIEKLQPKQYIILQVYTRPVEVGTIKLDSVRFLDKTKRTLYQPWGTDLLPEEFKKPTFSTLPFIFWIGSVWDNAAHQGNKQEIEKLRAVLQKHKIRLIPLRLIPEWLSIFLIRHSRLAPAIVGNFQREVDYLPCRAFKNISYGQLTFTNCAKFNELLNGATVFGATTEELVGSALKLSPSQYKEIILAQQAVIKNYTYKDSYATIFKVFEELA